MKPAQARGFTLIELVVTVAIIGVLAALAYPSYQDYIRKGNRAAAQSFMMTIAQRQEQHIVSNRSYTATIGTGGLGLSPPTEISGRYDVTMTAPTATSYLITATPIGNQPVAGKFDVLTLSSDGTKTPATEWQR